MFKWLKGLFNPESPKQEVNPYIGMFKGWGSTPYFIWDPEHKYCIWIANEDYGLRDASYEAVRQRWACPQAFVSTLNNKERRLVWEAIRHDLSRIPPQFSENKIRIANGSNE